MKLFLDDNPARCGFAIRVLGPDLIVTMTAGGAIRSLASVDQPDFAEVYLDHDLGDETYVDSSRPDTGYEVVRWIVANRPRIGRVIVHSHNTPAGNRMVADLRGAGYVADYVPFTTLTSRWMQA